MGITIPEGKSGSIFMCLEPNSPSGSLWEPLVCQKMQVWVPQPEGIGLDYRTQMNLINPMCLQHTEVL